MSVVIKGTIRKQTKLNSITTSSFKPKLDENTTKLTPREVNKHDITVLILKAT